MKDIMNELGVLIQSVIDEDTAKLDEDWVREDLMGLYMDIRMALKESAPDKVMIIYEYAKLLQKDAELYSPQLAFEAGALLATNPPEGEQKDEEDLEYAYMRYVCRVGIDPRTKALRDEIYRMYNEIHVLLGESSGLIGEFTDLYRKCHGTICKHIHKFFNMGYSYIREEIGAVS